MKALFSSLLLAGTIVVVLLLTACEKSAPPAQVKKPVPKVTVVTAHIQSVPLTHEAVGLLAPTQIAEVRARVAGVILKRVYTEGTDVRQGQVLFQIDPASLKAALHTREATLAKARADAVNAALIARRSQDLANKGLIASQDRDTALANQRITAAVVKAAEATAEEARLNLGYATVTAPIAGHAGRALVTKGALVGQGEATLLTTIEQLDPVYVNFSLPVAGLPQLQQAARNKPHLNTKVEVMLPDGTVYPHPGTLDFSAQTVDPLTGTVSLRAVVPNPARQLLPGMFIKLRLNMGQLDHAFLLPQATVQRDKTGAYIIVLDTSGKVEKRRVQTHGMTLTDWIITGKLADGDRVITEGLQKVKPGMMAKAEPSTLPTKPPPTNGAAATKSASKPASDL